MTLRLDLKPEVEAHLAAQARARGVTLEAYLQDVIEDLAGSETSDPASARDLTSALDALAAMGKNIPHLPTSAFLRESIYRDRD